MEALVIVDLQHDFISGSLAVPGADAAIAAIDTLTDQRRLIVASRDLHPADHSSFADQGGIWPAHCVNQTRGASLHPVALNRAHWIVSKGRHQHLDAYSAFDGTDLAARLRAAGINQLLVCGLATDYCVRATVLDGLTEGFEVTVITDAIAAVDLQPGDGERALAEMVAAGAELATSREDAAARAFSTVSV